MESIVGLLCCIFCWPCLLCLTITPIAAILSVPVIVIAIYVGVPVVGGLISIATTILIIYCIIKQQQKAKTMGAVHAQ